jgi:hypothetical protein
MEKITMETVIGIQIGTILLISIIGYFYKRDVSKRDEYERSTTDKLEKYHKATETTRIALSLETNKIKDNYLDRFEKHTRELYESREYLTKTISDSEKNLTKLIMENNYRLPDKGLS